MPAVVFAGNSGGKLSEPNHSYHQAMINALTETRVRNLKAPASGFVRFADGAGLYLECHASGGRWWRFRYRFEEKQKSLSVGVYPDTSIKDARERRDAARKLLAAGVDPGAARRAEKDSRQQAATGSFEAVAREWIAQVHRAKVSEGHSARTLIRLEQDVFPWLGKIPVQDIKPADLLKTLRRIEARGAVETAHRAKQACGQIFRYAIATGRAELDPSAPLREALRPVQEVHMAAITDPARVGELMRAIDGYKGQPVTRAALQLAALTFVRPGELRQARWDELDLDAAEWKIAAARMKRSLTGKANGADHLVPLSRQAVVILRDLHPLTGHRDLVFPGTRGEGRPLSDATVGAALRRLGFPQDEMSGHGFRAMARTMLAERLGVDDKVIEAQLGHNVKDPLGRAYNRTQFAAQRVEMMQAWASYLDRLRAGAEVVQIRPLSA